MNVNAAAAAAAAFANVSAIMTSPGASCCHWPQIDQCDYSECHRQHCGGSGVAQKAINANTQKGLGSFSQFNPLIATQKAENANNQKGLGRFSQLNPLVKLRLQPACSTRRA